MNDNGAPGFRPIDIATLIYCASEAILVAVFMSSRRGWFFLFSFYLAACGIVLVFALFQKYGFTRVLRLFYPLLFIPLLNEALGSQLNIFFIRPFDSRVNLFEMKIMEIDTAFALQNYMTIGLNEIMSFFYLYFYILPLLAIVILIIKRRWDSLEKMALAGCAAFYVCFAIHILYPVLGPRYYLENIYYLPFIGPLFTPLAQKTLSLAGLHGGAMPSSHCATALVFTWYLAKEQKRIPYLPYAFFILICMSAIYLRFNYLSDVIAGIFIGFISIMLTSCWQIRFLKAREKGISLLDSERSQVVGIDA